MEFTGQKAELNQLAQGPDHSWRRDFGRSDAREFPAALPGDAPAVARDYLKLAREVRESAAGKVIATAPERLRSHCHGRLIDGLTSRRRVTLEEILQDAVELGGEELAEQARPYLARRIARAGGEVARPEVYATTVQWREADLPGRARAHIKGRIWEVHDYWDRLKCPEGLTECIPGVAAGSDEERGLGVSGTPPRKTRPNLNKTAMLFVR